MPGLVDSFLNAFTQVSELHRQREQDKQAAVQQSVENAMREHAQTLEAQRIRTQEEQQKATQEHYLALEQQAAAALKERTEHDIAGEAQKQADRLAADLKEANRVKSETAKAYAKAFGDAAIRGGGTPRSAHAYATMATSGFTPDPQQQQEITAFAQSIVGTDPDWMDKPFPLPAALQKQREGRAALTAEQLKQLQDMGSLTAEYKKAQIQSAVALAKVRNLEAQAIPKRLRQQDDRLNLERMRVETDRLRVQIQAGGNAAIAAREEAKTHAQALQKYADGWRTVRDKKTEELRKATDANAAIGPMIQSLYALEKDGKLDAGGILKLQGLRAQWAGQNNVDPTLIDGRTGKAVNRITYLDYEREKAENEYKSALHAQGLVDSVTSQKVTPLGTLRPITIPNKPPANTAELDRSAARNRPAPVTRVRVKTPAEASKLKPGTHYVTPDGREFVR